MEKNPHEAVFAEILHQAKHSDQIVITTHYNPDGDAVGSTLALYRLLKTFNESLTLLLPNSHPEFLDWLFHDEHVLIYEDDKEQAANAISRADLIFCIDFNALSRVKHYTKALQDSSAVKVLIDHHPDPEDGFDHMISDTSVSSTAELVYEFIVSAVPAVTREMGNAVFTGIMTDTGSFNYSCSSPRTFEIVAELIRAGVEVEKIHRKVYDTYSESRMRLLGFSLAERMVILPEYHAAYIWLTRADLARFNYRNGDTEGLVNLPLSINGINLSALFTERQDRVRISFRSKGDFPVNELAKKHYAGGGHLNASGGDSFAPMEETLKKFESVLAQYKESLSHVDLQV